MVGSKAARALRRATAEQVRSWPVVQDPRIRRYFGGPANWFFLFAAVVLYSVSWPTLPMTHHLPVYTLPVVAAFAAFPVALAASAPLLGWAISAVSALAIGVLVQTANGWPWAIQVTHLIAFLVLTFMSFLRCPLRLLAPWWLCAVAVIVLVAPHDQRVGWAFGLTSLAVVVALLRGLLASRRQLAVQTEETKVAESTTAVLTERARIARDLHDVVAHRMSMVVVMAQTARYRIPEDVSPVAAAEFDAIADAARASLDEVRQLLGVLRVEGSDAAAAPNPGLGDIGSLIEQTRRAGVAITVTDELDHARFAESAALVIYRIVQESLANATRHAPGAPIEVRLTPDSHAAGAQVVVANAAPTAAPLQLGGAGVGIPGMGERAHTVGGSLTATPTPGGGFAVRAWIPPAPHPAAPHSAAPSWVTPDPLTSRTTPAVAATGSAAVPELDR